MHLVTKLKPPATELEAVARNSADGDGNERHFPVEEFDSACSTPFVSAPSSPTRGSGGGGAPSGYFFSAPASPVHYVPSSAYREPAEVAAVDGVGVTDFEFSSRYGSSGSHGSGSMSSADELFLNGKIRPMKLSLSSHLQRPQTLLLDLEEDDETGEEVEIEETFMLVRGRDIRMRNRSIHRKTRSLSPLRNEWREECLDLEQVQVLNEGLFDRAAKKQSEELEQASSEATAVFGSASSSRSSSTASSRNSKKWIFLKDLLYRSKSEGRASTTKDKFWSSISFSPAKEKKSSEEKTRQKGRKLQQPQKQNPASVKNRVGKPANGNVSKRRVPPSAHERHYTANRAQAEEMKKKTYLPYRQGLFGCLGFSSKGYGALHGFTRTLNPVSSR